jgi:hypothetical protein
MGPMAQKSETTWTDLSYIQCPVGVTSVQRVCDKRWRYIPRGEDVVQAGVQRTQADRLVTSVAIVQSPGERAVPAVLRTLSMFQVAEGESG